MMRRERLNSGRMRRPSWADYFLTRPKLLVLAFLFGASGSAVHARPELQTPAREFSDGEFYPGDWLMMSLQNHPDIHFQEAQIPHGGNPGAFRSVSHHLPAAPAGLSPHAVSLHRYLGGSYKPAEQGSFEKICYASDVAIVQGFGDGQSRGPALWQSGHVYVSAAGFTGVPAGWEQRGPSIHRQNEFYELLPGADRDLDSHPDFSAAGAPLWFGFFRSNTTRQGPHTIEGAIDNWHVEIDCDESLPPTATPPNTLPPTQVLPSSTPPAIASQTSIPSPTSTLTPTQNAPYPGPTLIPTQDPSPIPTQSPTATATPLPSPSPGPATQPVCRIVVQQVPPAVINDALANPERYQGWRIRLDPNKPPSPANPLRESLNLRNPALAYHPLWNAPLWRAGCH